LNSNEEVNEEVGGTKSNEKEEVAKMMVKQIVKEKIAAARTALGTPHPTRATPLRWAMTQAMNGCAPKAPRVRTPILTWKFWALLRLPFHIHGGGGVQCAASSGNWGNGQNDSGCKN
jgi:hypothetical protein